MVLYGLLSHRLAEIIEWYRTIDDAQTDIDAILLDEPEWREELEIVELATC